MLDSGQSAVRAMRRIEATRGNISSTHPHMNALHDPWQDVGGNPKTILGASLLAWYRADLGITLNGSNVSAWADQSGRGDANRNALQGTGALQPAFSASTAAYGGKPTVNFPSANATLLSTGTWSVALAQVFTIYIAGNASALAGNRFFLGVSSGARTVEAYDTGVGVAFSTDGSTTTLTNANITANTASIVYFVGNGASSKIGVRQNTAQVTGNANTGGAIGLTLGNVGSGGAPSLDGPIAEVIVSSGNFNPAVTAYMAARYGIVQGA